MKNRILTYTEVQLILDAEKDPALKKSSSYRSLKSRCKSQYPLLLGELSLVASCCENKDHTALTELYTEGRKRLNNPM